jgi:hypothetical protein
MSSTLQQHLVDHGPITALVSGMILLGSLVNKNATESTVYPEESWCVNHNVTTTADLENFISIMPDGLGAATIVIVVIFPLVPILINSRTKTWNDFKVEILKCHVVGQTSVFGVAELLRHFLISPEPTFLQKCNITAQECSLKSHAHSLLPLNDPRNISFCNASNVAATELFNSLHHFPDKTCCIIGASIVTFLATLYFWNKINKTGKSIYEAHSIQQCFLIFIQLLCITLVLTYLYFLYNSFDSVQLYGLLIGAILQFMIIWSTLLAPPNKNDDDDDDDNNNNNN